ncbi:tyrosine/nicotianamine aminotransferase, pyridoxal phosphate-dependent transferase [Tanacetum coccineum]
MNINKLLGEALDMLYKKLKEIPHVDCHHKPEGSMFAMLNLSDFDDTNFCMKLAKEESMIVFPRKADGLKNWIRVLKKAARTGLEDATVERYRCDVKVLVDACDVDGVYEVEEEDSDDDTLLLHKVESKNYQLFLRSLNSPDPPNNAIKAADDEYGIEHTLIREAETMTASEHGLMVGMKDDMKTKRSILSWHIGLQLYEVYLEMTGRLKQVHMYLQGSGKAAEMKHDAAISTMMAAF